MDLIPQWGSKFYYNYNSKIDARITNEFATVAYRFGHSLVTPNLKQVIHKQLARILQFQEINEIILRLYSIYGNRELQAIPLHDRYNNPVEIEKNDTFNQMVKGLILQPAGEVDTSFSIGVI